MSDSYPNNLLDAIAAETLEKHPGITLSDLRGDKKPHKIMLARAYFVQQARERIRQSGLDGVYRFVWIGKETISRYRWKPLSYPRIAKYLHKNHSTCILLHRKAVARLEADR